MYKLLFLVSLENIIHYVHNKDELTSMPESTVKLLSSGSEEIGIKFGA